MMNAARLALLYAAFAFIATLTNIGTQAVVVWLYEGPYAVQVSILIGTAAGLPLKYFLEKRYIFEFVANDFTHDSQLFLLYSLMGIGTTALFWGIEFFFHYLFATDAMRYLGGVLGLTLGYVIKYRLDKQFVFIQRRSVATGLL